MNAFMKVLSSAGVVSSSAVAYAQGQPQGHGAWPGMMGWGYGMGWHWPIIMFAIWIVVIVGVVYFVRTLLANRCRGGAPEESALDILKKRYAKGEINKDEFEKMKKDIS